ncbi:MAG TPA: transaldolase family protein, partial [Thermoanaerobaculia bacterium]|nr:transaldolase family protein [Thermoanaerobaculia bacterium]
MSRVLYDKAREARMNALKQLNDLGQAFWMDFIRRKVLTDGEVKRLIGEDGLSGMTSNPTIFDEAIGGGEEYDEQLHELLGDDPEASPADVFESIEVRDIQMAADLLKVVYDRTDGGDGYISLEVPPDLAHDTERTVEVARHLWERVDRPNLMIKVPATAEG